MVYLFLLVVNDDATFCTFHLVAAYFSPLKSIITNISINEMKTTKDNP